MPRGVDAENIVEQTWDDVKGTLSPERRTYIRFAETRERYRELLIGAWLVNDWVVGGGL